MIENTWNSIRIGKIWKPTTHSAEYEEYLKALNPEDGIETVEVGYNTTLNGIDLPERIFKVPLCGTITISDLVQDMHYYFPNDIMPMANDFLEYVQLIDYYLHNKNDREELQNAIKVETDKDIKIKVIIPS